MTGHVTLFLCGDVMTGRGIDQILPYPGDPTLHEPSIRDAADYVKLAERFTGAIPRPCQFDYIWGDALKHLRQEAPQAIITNLETAITRSESHWPSKDVHYKMSPENIACLTEAEIDCCVLANNHMLDWGFPGLFDTLGALDKAGIKHVGAGRNLREAQEPAILPAGEDSRVIVFSLGSTSSGIPIAWSAEENHPGLYVIETQRNDPIRTLAQQIDKIKRRGDVVVVSIHWGGNWGYKIPGNQKEFAHRLVDEARVDIVHGHSSHHVKAIEVYKERLILYGCGDFLNDYEGITGYESFRGDLGLMYFAEVEPRSGKLHSLRMIPTQVRRFRVSQATAADSKWLETLLKREGKRFGTAVQRSGENFMTLDWS